MSAGNGYHIYSFSESESVTCSDPEAIGSDSGGPSPARGRKAAGPPARALPGPPARCSMICSRSRGQPRRPHCTGGPGGGRGCGCHRPPTKDRGGCPAATGPPGRQKDLRGPLTTGRPAGRPARIKPRAAAARRAGPCPPPGPARGHSPALSRWVVGTACQRWRSRPLSLPRHNDGASKLAHTQTNNKALRNKDSKFDSRPAGRSNGRKLLSSGNLAVVVSPLFPRRPPPPADVKQSQSSASVQSSTTVLRRDVQTIGETSV